VVHHVVRPVDLERGDLEKVDPNRVVPKRRRRRVLKRRRDLKNNFIFN
jgi:hypothetical protein